MLSEVGEFLGGILKPLLKDNEIAKRIGDAFRRKHAVLVLGVSGVGKSQLLTSLKDSLPDTIDRLNRTETLKHAHIQLSRDQFDFRFDFEDTPGQTLSEARRRQAIADAASHGALIVNVVAYGYHEYNQDTNLVFEPGDPPRVRADYLAVHRQKEIDALGEWLPTLGTARKISGLVTVLNKADLWWDDEVSARAHYESGDYHAALRGANSLRPMTVPYCATFHKFYGRAPMAGTVDDSDRKRLRDHLIETLVGITAEAQARP